MKKICKSLKTYLEDLLGWTLGFLDVFVYKKKANVAANYGFGPYLEL